MLTCILDGVLYKSLVNKTVSWLSYQSLLILIPIRLGIENVNPIYHPALLHTFSFPQSIGISGYIICVLAFYSDLWSLVANPTPPCTLSETTTLTLFFSTLTHVGQWWPVHHPQRPYQHQYFCPNAFPFNIRKSLHSNATRFAPVP